MAYLNGRNFVGIDISEEYCEIARQRLEQAQMQQGLFA
jgi:DNA modification methylase